MMIYGEFKDYNNDVVRVEIENLSSSDADVEIGSDGILFSGSPIQIQTEIDNTFEHIIRKSATINLVTKGYVGDYFFADNARSVTVRITRNSDVLFDGYLEPNTFSQGYSLPLEEFTLNCTDFLSTLQYIRYGEGTIDTYDALKSEASNKSFMSILTEIFGTERKIWYDLSKAKDAQSDASTVFADLGINENYIYGEDFDDLMTQQDVLEEMMRYLNLHIVQHGEDFFMFDWDTIRNERDSWVEIFSGETKTEPVQHITLRTDHHADNATNISIADVYNQIQVTCDLNSEETVIESPLDDDALDSYYSAKTHYMTEFISGDRSEFLKLVRGEETSNNTNRVIEWYFQPMYNSNWKLHNAGGDDTDLVLFDSQGEAIDAWRLPYFAKSNQISPFLFRFGSVEKNTNLDNSPISSITMKDYLYISVNGNADNTESGASPTEETIHGRSPIIEFTGSNGGGVYSPNDDETTNYLVFSGKMTLQPIQWESDHYQNCVDGVPSLDPFTKSTTMGSPHFFPYEVPVDGGEKFYTRKFYRNTYPRQTNDVVLEGVNLMPPVANMSFKFEGDKYGSSDFKYQYSANGDGTDKLLKLPILECELIIGDKRLVEYDMDELGGSKFIWTDRESGVTETYVDTDGTTKTYLKQTFSLGVNPKIDDIILGKEFDIQNTIDYRMNIDAEGMAIPIKKSDGLSGAVTFRILGPVNLVWNDITRRHPSFWRHTKWYDTNKIILCHLENIILTDFTAKIYTDGGGYSSLNSDDKDLIYLSNETQRYINRKDDITFRFITQLTSKECKEKGISPSICINAVIGMEEKAPINSIYNAATNETAKAEEHYVDEYYREYSRPRIMMETRLHSDLGTDFRNIFNSTPLGKSFHVQSIDSDVREATDTITLKEI